METTTRHKGLFTQGNKHKESFLKDQCSEGGPSAARKKVLRVTILQVYLPSHVSCSHCVLMWRYVAGIISSKKYFIGSGLILL